MTALITRHEAEHVMRKLWAASQRGRDEGSQISGKMMGCAAELGGDAGVCANGRRTVEYDANLRRAAPGAQRGARRPLLHVLALIC